MEPLIPENFYHIFNHSNGSELLFREYKNYNFFLEKYEMYIDTVADTYAYCLMPNHFHLLVGVKNDEDILSFMTKTKFFKKYKTMANLESKERLQSLFISKQFSRLFSSYTQSFNREYSRMGSLFIKNFKRKQINKESYFIRLINYIHFNPVNHGFVDQPGKWKFSSYNDILSDKPSILKRDFVLETFGGISNFISCHSNPMEM